MAIRAGVRPGSFDWGLAAGTEIVDADDIADGGLGGRGDGSERDQRETGEAECELHFDPSLAGVFIPEYWKTCTRRLKESTT